MNKSLIANILKKNIINSEFTEAKDLIRKNLDHLNDCEFISFFDLYIKYLSTFDVFLFKKLFGFSDSNKRDFFDLIHLFPIRPQDNKIFTNIISGFFSENTISTYEAYSEVYQNKYSTKTFDNAEFGDISYKYILSGNLQKGWVPKILGINSQIPPFVDLKKFTQPKDISGKTILVTPEQGFGDNIIHFRMWQNFCKNNPSVKIIFIARDALFELFCDSNTCENMKIYSLNSELIFYSQLYYDYFCFDYFAPLFLLLRNNSIENYPTLIGDAVQEQKSIGIFWSTELRSDSKIRLKNVPLCVFWDNLNLDAFSEKGYSIHSLQAKHSQKDLPFISHKNIQINELNNFKDTSRLIQKCEKIFSIDTGVLHLSKALKKDVTCVFNYYKGFHYDRKNGLYPSIKTINLCDKVFEHFNKELNNT